VILRVWAEKTRDGRPVGFQGKDYETPGHFYLHTKQGWVQISEGLFPMCLGFWMDIFGMAGRGSPTPTVDGTNW
jgi:hypothetical protein